MFFAYIHKTITRIYRPVSAEINTLIFVTNISFCVAAYASSNNKENSSIIEIFCKIFLSN